MMSIPRQVSATALTAAFLVCGTVTILAADEDFPTLVGRLEKEKPQFAERQQKMLDERYDLADRPAKGVTMSRGKAVQDGVRVKLADGMTWEKLAAMTPENVFHPVHVAILMRREDRSLRDFINIWIDQIEMDGTLAKIRTKWLGS